MQLPFSSITVVRQVTACSAGDRPRVRRGRIFTYSFIYAYLFVNIRLLMLSIRVFRDIIKNYVSILDYIGTLDRRIV